jgi:hypothetical protein
LLAEVRGDPTGWPALDLHKLLDLWGFAGEAILDQGRATGVTFRYHPEHKDLNVALHPVERTHAAVALHVVRIIDTLRERRGIFPKRGP